ncbi:MAG TPA: hypothetical protein DDY22_22460 [Geobacter sp.]|nr:hypothetical protein [Geobacter sp.]
MRELRRFQRVAFPYRIELACSGRSYQGTLENLSLNGALVELDDRISVPAGQPCTLCIHSEEEAETNSPLQMGAEAIHGSSSLIGMRFAACDDETRGRLLLLVERITSDPDRLEHDLDRIRAYLADYHSAL